MATPRLTLTGTNIGAPDANALADFYRRLLGWATAVEEPGWVILRSPGGGPSLNFQTEAGYVRPAWPTRPGGQQMMMHLEILVDDLAAGVAHAVAEGATLAEFQPQDDVRVCLDPAGHPFCLFTEEELTRLF
jgi:catechol 2,3-dioxygenase-like lactoylglutathione lyase family enzyme